MANPLALLILSINPLLFQPMPGAQTQTIAAVSPTSVPIVAVGSANHNFGPEVITMAPSSPSFAGTCALRDDGTGGYMHFTVPTPSACDFAVGTSDLPVGTYTMNYTATPTNGAIAPSTVKVTATATASTTVPPGAAAAGFTTVALDNEFSTAPSLSSFFGCRGQGPGYQWYSAISGGDSANTVPCSNSGGTSRFNLATDPLSGKQVFDLTFLPSDIIYPTRHYTSIYSEDDSAGPPNCCVHGVNFPSNYYMEVRYRVMNSPAVPKLHMSGLWWAFWQTGEGVDPPGSRWNSTEVDHPEQHGEWPELMDWAVLVRGPGQGGGYFAQGDTDSIDSSQYHTFGVRSTTDGAHGLAICAYIDGVQRPNGCNTFSITDANYYSERKFPIIFAGNACYNPGDPTLFADCINNPIASIYSCPSPNSGKVCLHTNTQIHVANYWPVWFNISGVTGQTAINGPHQMTALNWNDGATDWVMTDLSYSGASSGGTINPQTQMDLMIDYVRVWSCSDWNNPSGNYNCNRSLLMSNP